MSETMMVRGNGSESHRILSGLQLAPGFGFAKDMVIDQHFAERGRIGRLLGVVGQNPRIIGVGIDENTAILVEAQREFRVFGEGGVTVLDGRNVTYSNIAEADVGCTMSVFGVTLHLLGAGDVFDLRKRQPRDLPASTTADAPPRSRAKGNGKSNGNGKRNGNGRRRTAVSKSR
jgi:cyanophycinase